MNAGVLTDQALDVIFREAHTAGVWLDRPVEDATLRKIHDLMKLGPTSANCSPLRIVFVKSPEARARLKPALMEGNVEKTMTAPVTAVFGQDMAFYENLPRLFPQTDAKAWFAGNDALIAETAFRNSTLQAAYFLIAARACGLDCGPMSGFDKAKAEAAFFPGGKVKANFLCNLGYADRSAFHPRNPRLGFDEACEIA